MPGPGVSEALPAPPENDAGNGWPGGIEAGGPDQHVEAAALSVCGHHLVTLHLGDGLGHQFHVGLLEGRIIIVADQNPLTADPVRGRQFLPQCGVRNLRRQMPVPEPLDQFTHPPVGKPQVLKLRASEDVLARQALQQRKLPEGPPPAFAGGLIQAWHHPGRGPLEDRDLRGHLPHLWHELDGRRARADHRHPVAPQVGAVIPAGRMEAFAPEALQARNLGPFRIDQRAVTGDQHAGAVLSPAGPDAPEGRLVVPAGLLNLMAEADMGRHAVLLCGALQVRQDLRLAGVAVRPVGVGREREGVQIAPDVAGAAGVGVVAPGASYLACPLEQYEIVRAALPEPDRHPQAREARAENGDLNMLHLGHPEPPVMN